MPTSCRVLAHVFALAAILATVLDADVVRAEEEKLPAVERCRLLCVRVYGPAGSEYEECALACTDADDCHQGCRGKFGTDVGKIRQCLRSCMRRKAPGGEPAGKPVEL